jgi:hypothetical protein
MVSHVRRLDWNHNRSGRFREEKNPLPLPGIEPRFLDYVARNHVPLPEVFAALTVGRSDPVT